MDNLDFCHLHVHSEYSMLDGFGTTDNYAKKASELEFKYLGLTDHGLIDGLIKFQKSCKKYNITPILGCEGYIIPEIEEEPENKKVKKKRKNGHICLFVKNQTGFENLCNLLTFANTEGFYYKPRFTFQALLDNIEGLIVSTACVQSFTRVFNNKGIEFFYTLYDILKEDLYCEIMPHKLQVQIKTNKLKLKLAKKVGCKIIATNDCHYINKADHKAHEVLLAIQTKAKWEDPKRWRFNIKGLHLRSTKEMIRALKKIGFYKKEYLHNTIEIAEKCSGFIIPKRKINLPRVNKMLVVPRTEKKFLWNLCVKGFNDKFYSNIKNNNIYYNRLKEEYELIISKKFHRYFLIVWELVNWCKYKDILMGPRGSVGGSLLAYLIGITTVDPIKHNLIFSRFINEDRIDYPDIDIDFEDSQRHLIKEHLESKYGEGNIAGVSSFNRMKARAAIKNVGRVFDIHHSEINEFTKLVEDNEEGTGIQDAIESWDKAKRFAEEYPKVIKYAKELEGIVVHKSQHAAALVLSKDNIGYSGRCNLTKRKDTSLVNWEKDDTEYVGLMKIDALGLKLLSILSEAKKLIEKNHNKEIDFEKINLNDKSVLEEINDGNTVGLFQLNTYATTSLIKEMGIENFNHVSDAIALVRPGPTNSGMTADYIKRKHGISWIKHHKIYEEITKDTFGILVYQEQIMEVICKVGGLPYSTADNIRKIIGKKRSKKEFRPYKKQFVKGCKKTKIFNREEANEFWEVLKEHAKYSFNKAHSVSYAMLAMWCAWLKKYYPTEFICASLTFGAQKKKSLLTEEAYRLGLKIVLPKVNKSDPIKWIAKRNKLYIPFIEIKGIGKVKAILASTAPTNIGIKKFFNKKQKKENIIHKGSLGNLLKEIGAYDQSEKLQIADKTKDLFEFRITSSPRESYPNLYSLFDNNLHQSLLDSAVRGDPKALIGLKNKKGVIHKVKFKRHKNLLSCTSCNLKNECTAPVHPSSGIWNIAIVGEAPGSEEDKHGRGFYEEAPAAKVLWSSLGKKYPRKLFHISNVNKCFPRESRKPSKEQIKICGKKYLHKELKKVKPILILAFGNTSRFYFTGETSGILNISGKTEWNEEYSSWVVWCVHPAAILHNPDNKPYYLAGIKQFKKMIRILAPQIKSKI